MEGSTALKSGIRETQTYIYTHTDGQTNLQTGKMTDRQKMEVRLTDETVRQISRQTDRLIGRQAGNQTYIQTDRPTDRKGQLREGRRWVENCISYKRVTCFQNANYTF
jgi:hypothetical protein